MFKDLLLCVCDSGGRECATWQRDDALFQSLYVCLLFLFAKMCFVVSFAQELALCVCVVVILYMVSSCVCRARDNKQRVNTERQEDQETTTERKTDMENPTHVNTTNNTRNHH